jgi:hypothetical protein
VAAGNFPLFISSLSVVPPPSIHLSIRPPTHNSINSQPP